MEASRNHSNSGRHADAHVDIPNLRNRRVGKHTFHRVSRIAYTDPITIPARPNTNRNVNDLQLQHNIYGKYAVNQFDSKENITFQYQTGQHPAGCRNCRLISAGQHGMEREQRALDSKTDEHKTCYHQQREVYCPVATSCTIASFIWGNSKCPVILYRILIPSNIVPDPSKLITR